MALLWLESFDGYSGTDILTEFNSKGATTVSISGTYGRNGTNGILISNNTIELVKAFSPSGNTFIAGAATKWVGGDFIYLANTPTVFQCRSAAGAHQCELRFTTAGQLEVYRGSTKLAGPGPTTLVAGAWYYIEFQAVVRTGTNGSFEVRINGVTELSGTGVNTANTGADGWGQIFLNAPAFYGGHAFDDFYVCDGSGTKNNDFMGPIRVKQKLVTGDGFYTQMTPSAGSNFQCVDEAAANSDTDFVSTSTVGNKDTYEYAASGLSGSVKGIRVRLVARSDGDGSETIAPVLRIGGTDYEGAAQSVSTTYLARTQHYDVSPDTSDDWTLAEVDAMEMGPKLVS